MYIYICIHVGVCMYGLCVIYLSYIIYVTLLAFALSGTYLKCIVGRSETIVMIYQLNGQMMRLNFPQTVAYSLVRILANSSAWLRTCVPSITVSTPVERGQ